MHVHANAKLGLSGRHPLVCAIEGGLSLRGPRVPLGRGDVLSLTGLPLRGPDLGILANSGESVRGPPRSSSASGRFARRATS
jgi:hypothetical protein